MIKCHRCWESLVSFKFGYIKSDGRKQAALTEPYLFSFVKINDSEQLEYPVLYYPVLSEYYKFQVRVIRLIIGDKNELKTDFKSVSQIALAQTARPTLNLFWRLSQLLLFTSNVAIHSPPSAVWVVVVNVKNVEIRFVWNSKRPPLEFQFHCAVLYTAVTPRLRVKSLGSKCPRLWNSNPLFDRTFTFVQHCFGFSVKTM